MLLRNLLSIFTLSTSILFFGQNPKTFTYKVKGLDSLKLDVYTPENLNKDDRLPVIIWMHGGGFSQGSRKGMEEATLMNYLVENNFIGVSISYRLLRKGQKSGFGCNCPKEDKLYTFAQATEDLMDAAKFLVDHSDSLQIDSTRMIPAGVSAGAEAVLSAVYLRDYYLTSPNPYSDIQFAGVIGIAGAILDTNYITEENAVPTLLYHGNRDRIVPFGNGIHHSCSENKKGYLPLSGSEAISERLKMLKRSVYLHEVDQGNHGNAVLPASELDFFMNFIKQTVINKQLVQTWKLTQKE